jgi:hypothetical protein
MNTNLIRQYRAQLFDENGTTTITSASLADCQRKVASVLGTKPRYEEQGSESNTQSIFSPSHFDGKQPVGWIVEMEVPAVLGVKSVTENRIAAQRAA